MNIATYLERLYCDKLTIKRYIPMVNEDGTTDEILDDSNEYNDIPCRISSLKEDQRDLLNWDVDETFARIKVFLSPSIKINKGDEVYIQRYLNGEQVQEYKGHAGDPLVYDIAQEFILVEKRLKNVI